MRLPSHAFEPDRGRRRARCKNLNGLAIDATFHRRTAGLWGQNRPRSAGLVHRLKPALPTNPRWFGSRRLSRTQHWEIPVDSLFASRLYLNDAWGGRPRWQSARDGVFFQEPRALREVRQAHPETER